MSVTSEQFLIDGKSFVTKTDHTTATVERMTMSTKDNAVITEIANKLHFPPTLTRVYELLDSDAREFTYHKFTFFNINIKIPNLRIKYRSNTTEPCKFNIIFLTNL